jgi:hypothetical protein
MRTKNAARITAAESAHMAKVKSLSCSVCDAPGPSEAHHIKQGSHYLCCAICPDCHRGHNGLHGTKAYMRIKKLDELDLLAITIRRLMTNEVPT